MQRQQGEEGAVAEAQDSSSSSSGKTKNTSTTGGEFALGNLDLDKADAAALESVLANSPLRALEGPVARMQALLELRLFAASLLKEERLDFLTYIVEERKLPPA